jgi:hypothetical protein
VFSLRAILRPLFVWLLLPVISVSGLPGGLCACACAETSVKGCCTVAVDAPKSGCCCEHVGMSCDCCAGRPGAGLQEGACGCSVQATEPAAPAIPTANAGIDLAVAWLPSYADDFDFPRVELASARFLIPLPHDLVIELRNLRI